MLKRRKPANGNNTLLNCNPSSDVAGVLNSVEERGGRGGQCPDARGGQAPGRN